MGSRYNELKINCGGKGFYRTSSYGGGLGLNQNQVRMAIQCCLGDGDSTKTNRDVNNF